QRGGPAGEPRGAAVTDGAVHEQVATAPRAGTELLPTPLCAVRHRWLMCDHFTCHGNNRGRCAGPPYTRRRRGKPRSARRLSSDRSVGRRRGKPPAARRGRKRTDALFPTVVA